MAIGTWEAIEDLVSPAELTVQAQAVPPNDEGKLLWDIFFPREDVPSVRLWDVTTLDYRPAADRREWNARGRRIPMLTPARRNVEIVPIEANDKIDEKEIQRLMESATGNAEIFREAIGVTLPKRAEMLAESCYRRLELDAFKAWSTGTIIQRNPETGATYTVSFGFPSDRITTELTAWSDGSLNAYDELLAWIADAEDKVGSVEGVMMRLATLNAILADAPDLPNSVKMTRSELADRITQDRGSPFSFYVNEQRVDVFNDGGTAYTRTDVWPAETIAAIPSGKKVGRTAFAPVARAMDIADGIPESGVDVRGVTVYYASNNGGRELDIEAQLNALPIPSEQMLYVTDVGV